MQCIKNPQGYKWNHRDIDKATVIQLICSTDGSFPSILYNYSFNITCTGKLGLTIYIQWTRIYTTKQLIHLPITSGPPQSCCTMLLGEVAGHSIPYSESVSASHPSITRKLECHFIYVYMNIITADIQRFYVINEMKIWKREEYCIQL